MAISILLKVVNRMVRSHGKAKAVQLVDTWIERLAVKQGFRNTVLQNKAYRYVLGLSI